MPNCIETLKKSIGTISGSISRCAIKKNKMVKIPYFWHFLWCHFNITWKSGFQIPTILCPRVSPIILNQQNIHICTSLKNFNHCNMPIFAQKWVEKTVFGMPRMRFKINWPTKSKLFLRLDWINALVKTFYRNH